jgi:hypothetical protein
MNLKATHRKTPVSEGKHPEAVSEAMLLKIKKNPL